ncbi:MAG TPA: hypothetical protein VFT82_02000 [Candidatus Paceibacterota bacterium]|nr:hypothetical protein [Candidatus Paceibacterota bacterium]
MQPKTQAIIEFSLLALCVGVFLWFTYPKFSPAPVSLVEISTTTRALPLFPQTDIEAQSAYVYDAFSGKTLYEKDPDTERPLASLTKLMSALTASMVAPDYLLVRITPDDIREEGDTGLYVDESWNISDLLDYTLITSSNDGIRAIAEAGGSIISSTSTDPVDLFVAKMNSLAKQIGLTETHFVNQSGLDVSKTLSGGYGSARDIVMLVNYIIKNKPRLVEATTLQKADIPSKQYDHVAVNTDVSIPNIPNIIASKTGYTDLAGGNLVVAFNAGLNHPVIISVLGSTYEGRFTDLVTLVKSTLTYLDATGESGGIPLKRSNK